ncbi:hypothetical protein C443_00567 [Haloarcula argentinensis DSM 12282]|uniref:Uncharacterized protein n=1 Tax=Haloarcula argentinensis TaxID=43776 RepID=A0A830FRL4_HALAR|nr:hypothetical protein C443_00567 [Haloarcula argentinensis DSM 12282]GGM51311.1 hypothetical protein GCM10009006_35620 [Haloarcula argentinensis]
MSLFSGTTTVIGISLVGIVEMILHPRQYVTQMVGMATMLINRPSIVFKLPQLKVHSLQDQHETRNPFEAGEYAGAKATGRRRRVQLAVAPDQAVSARLGRGFAGQ